MLPSALRVRLQLMLHWGYLRATQRDDVVAKVLRVAMRARRRLRRDWGYIRPTLLRVLVTPLLPAAVRARNLLRRVSAYAKRTLRAFLGSPVLRAAASIKRTCRRLAIGLASRVRARLRQIRDWVYVKLTLYNHRERVKAWWPDARGFEYLVLVLWFVFLRFHDRVLGWVWKSAARLRPVTPTVVPATNRKVLHVVGSFDLGGSQTQIKNLCTFPAAQFEHHATEIYPEKNFLYRRNACIDPARYHRDGIVGRTLGRLVSDYRSRSPQLLHIYKLVCDFQAEKPAIVVGWGHELSAITFVAARMAGVPHVVFCIRTVNPEYYRWIPQGLARRLLGAHRVMTPLVSKVIVNSTLLKNDYAAWLNIDRDGIAVCPNGISWRAPSHAAAESASAHIRRAYNIPEEAVIIMNVGRFSEEKGQTLLVEVNERLRGRASLPPFVWLLYGDGPTLSSVRSAAEAGGMKNMIFPGRIDNVAEVLPAANIFVMPSDFEGMPNAMMEAMAAGLPCVSTNVSGALDIARDGIEALYCKPRDAAAFADHVARLLLSPQEAQALGRAAAARLQQFSVARSCTTFESALESVLGTRRIEATA